jgi:hypothetical protein
MSNQCGYCYPIVYDFIWIKWVGEKGKLSSKEKLPLKRWTQCTNPVEQEEDLGGGIIVKNCKLHSIVARHTAYQKLEAEQAVLLLPPLISFDN